jgi:subtilisin family serine protease
MDFKKLVILLLVSTGLFAQKSLDAELLVQFKNLGSFEKSISSKNPAIEFKTIIPEWNIYLLKFNSLEKNSLIEQLKNDLEVSHFQENHTIKLRNRPDDPKYDQWQWNMELLGLPEAWTYTTGGLTASGDSIVVAVIDGGCDLQHEDLQENIWYNHHEIPGDSIDNDQNGYIDDFRGWQLINSNDVHAANSHGTSVTGIIGAVGNNGIGISGINWNVKLMQVSAAESDLLLESNLLLAYAYVLKQRRLYRETNGAKGAFVVAVNLSAGVDYGKPEDFPLWCAVYDSLGKEGILSVGSVMNNDVNVDSEGDMPTLCPSPFHIAVTNSSRYDAMDLNAAYGKTNVDLAAPGAVYTLRPSNTYNSFGGTSGAAPHVAGAIALLAAFPSAEWAEFLKNEPQLSALFLKEIILKTVDKFSSFSEKSSSEGRLSVGNAMNLLKTYYSDSNNPITVQQWDDNQALIKFEIETAGEYSLEIFDLMGRLREKRNYNFDIPGQYRDFLDSKSRKNEILIARLSLKNGKRIGVVKF